MTATVYVMEYAAYSAIRWLQVCTEITVNECHMVIATVTETVLCSRSVYVGVEAIMT